MYLNYLHYENQNGKEVQDFEAVCENECTVNAERGCIFISGDTPHWRLDYSRETIAVKLDQLLDQLRTLFPQEFEKQP